MRNIKLIGLLIFLLLLPLFGSSCSSEKDIHARRNLMMPEKTDLPRNSKYQGAKKKKTYKPKKNKKRKPKKYSSIISGHQEYYLG